MAQSIRQSELFAGEDWRVLYRAFTEINFNAYDFNTIRQSMVEYIRFNFPEDFNDWIESSEFVALVDLIAYLGQTLAFRMDLNTRENFLEDAERRESVLKLARMLSYVPSRNINATGLVKIVSIETTEPIVDSSGQNLQNVLTEWNDPNNPDWYEHWVLTMNSSFNSTNPFGKPVKSGTISGIPVQLYEMNSNPVGVGSYSFNATVRNVSQLFEVVNVDFTDNETFYERDPDTLYSYHLLYRNDGLGNQSINTGFFMLIKQGSLSFEDFALPTPIENRVLDINVTNINNNDVWVQTINDDGTTLINWVKVPAVFGNNVIFNSLNENQRNIFSIITRDNDQISIRFADGVFGNVPTGIIRAYYRVSANSTFTVKTSDINRKTISIPYFNSKGDPYTLTVNFNLQESIGNSVSSETTAQIKERAPLVYYAQNRMVNGEDYNIYPLQNTNILKLKSINRIYSGHSRFIDINDPTATFQDVNVFADDGAVYEEYDNNYIEISLSANKTSGEIVSTILLPILKDPEFVQFLYREYPKEITAISGATNPVYPSGTNYDISPYIIWEQSSNSNFSSTGQFRIDSNKPTSAILGDEISPTSAPISIGVDSPAIDPNDFIVEGALLEFNSAGWVKVANILNDGVGFQSTGQGNVTIAQPVNNNDWVKKIYPAFRTDFVTNEVTAIKAEIDDKSTFGLRFDHTTQEWVIIKAANLAAWNSSTGEVAFGLEYAGDNSLLNRDNSWLVRFDFKTDHWEVTSRGLRYVYESEKDVRFFVNQFYKISGSVTGRASRDTITIFKTNPKPSSNTTGLGEDIVFRNLDIFIYEDGYSEPKRVLVTYNDVDEDGVPDDPDIFLKVVLDAETIQKIRVDTPAPEKYVFHSKTIDQFGYEVFNLDSSIVAVPRIEDNSQLTVCGIISTNLNGLQYYDEDCNVINLEPLIQPGTIVFDIKEATRSLTSSTDTRQPFKQYNGGDKTTPSNYIVLDAANYQYHIGRKDLNFLWKHITTKDQRIDPAITNIIDNLVMTTGYDSEYRLWLASGSSSDIEPAPPTSEQLDVEFATFDSYKMVSDEIIWRSAKYKPLFGEKAAEEYRARIKIVKVANTIVNDNEIKTQVINSINDFFAINNWDFGDSFFASELTAFIHQQLPTIVGGVEIVPLNEEARFGNLQQIKAESDEIFISAATISDVEIIPVFTETALRVGR
ncbi:MAG: hypothetical protein HC836_10785 [Richelia sp. RM2_1_2]|nr:hypothetical protein [Richelia sp. RM2_1_2]